MCSSDIETGGQGSSIVHAHLVIVRQKNSSEPYRSEWPLRWPSRVSIRDPPLLLIILLSSLSLHVFSSVIFSCSFSNLFFSSPRRDSPSSSISSRTSHPLASPLHPRDSTFFHRENLQERLQLPLGRISVGIIHNLKHKGKSAY